MSNSVTPWGVAHQIPMSMGFSRQEWVAMPSSRGTSWPRDGTRISCGPCIASGYFTTKLEGQPKGRREVTEWVPALPRLRTCAEILCGTQSIVWEIEVGRAPLPMPLPSKSPGTAPPESPEFWICFGPSSVCEAAFFERNRHEFE